MSLTAAQICTLSAQIAKCPGFTSQAGQLLNYILQELAQDYDFDVIRKTKNFNLSTSASGNGYAIGSGPNLMNSDFLRAHRNDAFYTISGVPYPMIGVSQEEFDLFVQQAGLNSYPYMFYVDVSTSPAGLYSLKGLPSGEYFVLALGVKDATMWQTPEAFARFSQTAQKITLAPRETRTVDVKVGGR